MKKSKVVDKDFKKTAELKPSSKIDQSLMQFEVIEKLQELKGVKQDHIFKKEYAQALTVANEIIKIASTAKISSYVEEEENSIDAIQKKLEKQKNYTKIEKKAKKVDILIEKLVLEEKMEEAHELVEAFKNKYEELSYFESIPGVLQLLDKEHKAWVKFKLGKSKLTMSGEIEPKPTINKSLKIQIKEAESAADKTGSIFALLDKAIQKKEKKERKSIAHELKELELEKAKLEEERSKIKVEQLKFEKEKANIAIQEKKSELDKIEMEQEALKIKIEREKLRKEQERLEKEKKKTTSKEKYIDLEKVEMEEKAKRLQAEMERIKRVKLKFEEEKISIAKKLEKEKQKIKNEKNTLVEERELLEKDDEVIGIELNELEKEKLELEKERAFLKREMQKFREKQLKGKAVSMPDSGNAEIDLEIMTLEEEKALLELEKARLEKEKLQLALEKKKSEKEE